MGGSGLCLVSCLNFPLLEFLLLRSKILLVAREKVAPTLQLIPEAFKMHLKTDRASAGSTSRVGSRLFNQAAGRILCISTAWLSSASPKKRLLE